MEWCYNEEVAFLRSKILALLREAGDSYLSGEEMAKRLGVSRTAVWKHIQELRRDGYDIVSHSRSGYSLQSAPDTLRPEEIKNGLHTKRIGTEIRFYLTIDSTNLEAKRLAQQGAPDGLVVVAEEQGKGRGRLERSFFSPAGKGIWFSVVLRPDFLPQDAPKCTLLSAVAVAKAAEDFGMKVGIKWPNDVLAGGKKLVGILTEMSAEMERIHYVIIGTGINVNIKAQDFPEELRDKAASFLQVKGETIPRAAFFRAVLEHMDALYDAILREGFAEIFSEWRRYSITLGQMVRVIDARGGGQEAFVGKAVDIDDDGALLVDTAEGRRRVLAGDVSIRPQQD